MQVLALLLIAAPLCYVIFVGKACPSSVGHSAPHLLLSGTYPCHGTFTQRLAYVLQSTSPRQYLQLLLLNGEDAWLSRILWLHLAGAMLRAVVPASPALRRPMHASLRVLTAVGLHLVHAQHALPIAGLQPSDAAWAHMQLIPLHNLMMSLVLPAGPQLEALCSLLGALSALAECLLCARLHPGLSPPLLPLAQQLLLTCAAVTLGIASAILRHRAAGCRHTPSLPAATPPSAAAAGAITTTASMALVPAAASGRRHSHHHHHHHHHHRYTAFLQRHFLRMKVKGVGAPQLPCDWCQRLRAALLRQTGGAVPAVCARDGCIELDVDLLLWDEQGNRLPLDLDELVAALGLQAEALGVTAELVPEPVDGGNGGAGGAGRAHPACGAGMPAAARIVWLQPRVLPPAPAPAASPHQGLWGPRFQVSVALPGLLHGPAAAGAAPAPQGLVGLTVRMRDLPLASACRHVPEYLAEWLTGPGGAEVGAAGAAAFASAAAAGSQLVHFELQLAAAPPHAGLMLVDCSYQLFSSSAPVVVVDDSSVALELQGAAATWQDTSRSLEGLLMDLGMFLDSTWQAKAAAMRSSGGGSGGDSSGSSGGGGGGMEADDLMSGAGSSSIGSAGHGGRLALGAHLCQHACLEGWVRTARWLLRDLQALGVDYSDIAPGRMLTRGSPTLIGAALSSRRPAATWQVLLWNLQHLLAPGSSLAGRWQAQPQAQGRGAVGPYQSDMALALLQAAGLQRGRRQDEAAYRRVSESITTSCFFVMLSVDLARATATAAASMGLCPWPAPWPAAIPPPPMAAAAALAAIALASVLAAAAYALLPRRAWARLATGTILPRHLLHAAGLLAGLLLYSSAGSAGAADGHGASGGAFAGAGGAWWWWPHLLAGAGGSFWLLLVEALLVSTLRPAPMPWAMLLLLGKLPLHAGVLAQAWQLRAQPGQQPRWAAAAMCALGIEAASAAAGLACLFYTRLRRLALQRAMQRRKAKLD